MKSSEEIVMSERTEIQILDKNAEQVKKYYEKYQEELDELFSDRYLLMERVNLHLIAHMLTQLITDIGRKNSEAIIERFLSKVRDGWFGEYDGEQLTPFEDIGCG
jgi:hypothetical protein